MTPHQKKIQNLLIYQAERTPSLIKVLYKPISLILQSKRGYRLIAIVFSRLDRQAGLAGVKLRMKIGAE
jgi:hypothetical protein